MFLIGSFICLWKYKFIKIFNYEKDVNIYIYNTNNFVFL